MVFKGVEGRQKLSSIVELTEIYGGGGQQIYWKYSTDPCRLYELQKGPALTEKEKSHSDLLFGN